MSSTKIQTSSFFFYSLLLTIGCSFALLPSCASLTDTSKSLDMEKAGKVRREVVPATQMVLRYTNKREGMAGFKCSPTKTTAKNSIILLNPDSSVFDQKDFCRANSLALLFMSNGYEVLALNRPDIGMTPVIGLDFNGPETRTVLQNLLKSIKAAPVLGIWAAGGATISAVELARVTPGVQWLALGSGFYDLELFSKDVSSDLGKLVSDYMSKAKDISKFQEERSPAWNITGIPPKIYVYHGKADKQVPWSFSKSFKDNLAAEGRETRELFQDEAGHDLSIEQHAAFVEELLRP